jgi:hypothetical protein
MPCFVVLTGKLEILMTRLSGERVLVTHGPGGFSGEMVLISGARSLSRGRVAEPGEFREGESGERKAAVTFEILSLLMPHLLLPLTSN